MFCNFLLHVYSLYVPLVFRATKGSGKSGSKSTTADKLAGGKKGAARATAISGAGSRSRSRSLSPRAGRRKQRSPTPRPTRIHVGRLTRNVNKDHLMEIFSVYGTVKNVDLPMYDVWVGALRCFFSLLKLFYICCMHILNMEYYDFLAALNKFHFLIMFIQI